MNRHQITRAAVLGAALALCGATSHAQTRPDGATAPAPETGTIKVRNMPANLLAYWLDPAHNPVPIQIQESKINGGDQNYGWTSGVAKMTRQLGNGNGPRNFKIPGGLGIESITSIDPENTLLVTGSDVGVAVLSALVREIDVPMGQVEIEAQIWEVAPAEFAQLPLEFRNASRSTAPSNDATFGELAFAPLDDDISDVTRQLQDWANTDRARLITAPRVTAIDGLAASLTSTETRAFDVNAMQENKPEPRAAAAKNEMPDKGVAAQFPIAPQAEKVDDNWKLGVSRIQDQTGFNALPVLHGDLIALAYQVFFNNELTMGSTIVRDGQTLPIRLASASATNGWTRLALIKTHILRLADNNANVVPGT